MEICNYLDPKESSSHFHRQSLTLYVRRNKESGNIVAILPPYPLHNLS